MRTTAFAWLAGFVLLGCNRPAELEDDQRPYAPPSHEVGQTVQVRNSCPEAVMLAISATVPEPSTPTMTLRSTGVEAVTVEQGARIWLRYDGRFDEERSIRPTGPVEIGYQCNSIYSRDGRQ
jgi:hypothetical protein